MTSHLLSRSAQKRAFFSFNTIFWVLGFGSLLIGLWSYVTKQTYVDLIPSSYGTLSAVGLCIAAGLTVIIITFVGCLGVWIESRLLLLAYIFFICLLLAVQFVVSILTLNYQSDIYRRVRIEMEQSLKYQGEVFTSSQLTWDNLQKVFLCCGVNGPADWFDDQKWSNSSYVPDSCCNKLYFNHNSSMGCGKDKENWEFWFQQGCSDVYANWIFEEIKIVAYIALVFICIEFLLLVLAVLIFRSVRKSRMSYNCSSSGYHYSKGISVKSHQKKLKNSFSRS
ncbi:Tetraspanin family protein [Brugia malayi]|uniref:Tetraspanin n=1 Tax=Brugia malayi TaxID=6279 RepID=A0A0K0J570_BRUMA|nr:Tetraspanin family protein [Brugia malayi]CDP97105.1 BMA-TSP-21 [Brugia malayi]VIO85914.1 Tetraspanin family protein [Brugia malayi]